MREILFRGKRITDGEWVEGDFCKPCNIVFTDIGKMCSEIKAEAYKECIEKVKEKSNKNDFVCSGTLVITDYTITEEDLDNLLKELERDT